MSWHFNQPKPKGSENSPCSQEQEEASWAESSLDGAPSALLSLLPIREASCSPDNATECLSHSRFGTTCGPSTESLGADMLTLSAEDSPVRTLAQRVLAPGSKEQKADFGEKWHVSLAKYCRVTSSWKTHQCLLFEDSTESLAIFPRWGMMRAGELWEQSMSAHLTREKESGLWPTPLAQDAKQNGMRPTSHATMLICAVRRAENRPTGGRLNPEWVEWLMGLPIGWTDLKPLEMVKFQQWLNSHGKL